MVRGDLSSILQISPKSIFYEIDLTPALRTFQNGIYWQLMKPKVSAILPTDTVLAEIEAFRSVLHSTMEQNARRMNMVLDEVSSKVSALAKSKKASTIHVRDLRDMLTLLRKNDVSPEKARRRDIKKLDLIAADLSMLTENW
jgi:hypothetical protein